MLNLNQDRVRGDTTRVSVVSLPGNQKIQEKLEENRANLVAINSSIVKEASRVIENKSPQEILDLMCAISLLADIKQLESEL